MKILIDTDCGLDDAHAICIAISHGAEVVGITTTSGNTGAKQAAVNVSRLLSVMNKEIPIFIGCSEALIPADLPEVTYHGNDGFGDHFPDSEHGMQFCKENAVHAMTRLARDYAGELILICIGPLTNVACALQYDENFSSNLKSCFIMGGNLYGRGNVTTTAEFNFAFDPEAAFIVLNRLHTPITILAWELCDDFCLDWETYHESRQSKTPVAELFRNIGRKMQESCKNEQWKGWVLCDEFAVAACLNERFISQSKEIGVSVERSGELTKGMMVCEWRERVETKMRKGKGDSCKVRS